MAVRPTRSDCEGFNAVDGIDVDDTVWNDSEVDGDSRSECEGDESKDCEDGNSDTDW